MSSGSTLSLGSRGRDQPPKHEHVQEESALRKMFLSYSGKDKPEVDRLDRELRRRGVLVWRDQRDLTGGRANEAEIEAACRNAAGFVFYLTHEAAKSRWVREKERDHALAARQQRSDTGIVPIFRDDRLEVREKMRALRDDPASRAEPYDLTTFQGYEVDPQKDLDGELRQAANKVLGSHLESLDATKPPGEAWTVGVVTRGGLAPLQYAPDLLLEWSEDFPSREHDAAPTEPPSPGQWKNVLEPALDAFVAQLKKKLGARALRVAPQCHLTLALAFGHSLRRNTSAGLTVVEPHSGDLWESPKVPLAADHGAWKKRRKKIGDGKEIALAINITQPSKSFAKQVVTASRKINAGTAVIFEPTDGASKTIFANLDPTGVHQRAVAVVEQLQDEPAFPDCKIVHLFLAAPVGFAILLAQQFSNVRSVQTYEWSEASSGYLPGCLLVSS